MANWVSNETKAKTNETYVVEFFLFENMNPSSGEPWEPAEQRGRAVGQGRLP